MRVHLSVQDDNGRTVEFTHDTTTKHRPEIGFRKPPDVGDDPDPAEIARHFAETADRALKQPAPTSPEDAS